MLYTYDLLLFTRHDKKMSRKSITGIMGCQHSKTVELEKPNSTVAAAIKKRKIASTKSNTLVRNEPSLQPIIPDSDSSDDSEKFQNNVSQDQIGEIVATLKNVYLFKSINDEDLNRIASKTAFVSFDTGTVIVTQQAVDGTNDPLYIVWHGKAVVYISGSETEIIHLKKGDMFGEISALFGSKRSADVCAVNDTVCISIPRSVLRSLPVARSLMFLRKVPILQGLSDNQIIAAYAKLSEQSFKDGEMMVEFGDTGSTVFIIRSGWVRVVRPAVDGNKEEEVAMLRRGQVVGQRTLIADGKRTASCIAAGEVRTLVFDNKMLVDLDNPALNELLDYDIVTSVFRAEGMLSKLGNELDLEKYVFDCIDFEMKYESDVIIRRDQRLFRFYIVKSGQVVQTEGENMIKCLNGISYFGNLSGQIAQGNIVAKTKVTLLIYSPQIEAPLPIRKIGEAGIKFTDLQIQRLVGKGNSGNVFLVRNAKNNKLYALKCIEKSRIRHLKQIQHAKNELHVIRTIKHPFCTEYVQSYQDFSKLYILQEWVSGGELFNQMQNDQTFKETAANFYAANVLCAIEHLHNYEIVYRDLKPENLLLDQDGYIKIADFGFAKNVAESGRTFTICGTPEYQAPEVVYKKGTTKEADYWSLGILIYEMLVGYTPFRSTDDEPYRIYQQARTGRFVIPNNLHLSRDAQDIIKKLIVVNPNERLGSGKGGILRIKSHPWFQNMDWNALLEKRIKSPLKPRIEKETIGKSSGSLNKSDCEFERCDSNIFPDEKWVDWPWI